MVSTMTFIIFWAGTFVDFWWDSMSWLKDYEQGKHCNTFYLNIAFALDVEYFSFNNVIGQLWLIASIMKTKL